MNTRETKPQIRNDWITRIPKWLLLSCFWILQAITLYLLQALSYQSQGAVGNDIEESDKFLEILRNGFFGKWPSWEEYSDLLKNSEFAIVIFIAIALLTVAQMIFMLPARKPGLTPGHGRSIRKSIAVAGGAIGFLLLGAIAGIGGFLDEVYEINLESEFINDLPGQSYTAIAIIIGFGWLVATPFLIKFSKPGRKEDVLARLSKKLFIGTIIEVALLIPLDVMLRRKTSCYCWAGTYWALTICGFIGVFALGPAVFLPILSKRRKTWYSGHCGVCGYDMAGMLDAPRCPECGTGWKDSPSKQAIKA
ncbi:hypothetical protein COB72_02930 [bacterium]|nr:MAG: hypothetical protein COB72_02930 [bacterium]